MIDDLPLMVWVGRLRRASLTGVLGVCRDARPFHYSIVPPFQPDADYATSPRCPASGNKPNSGRGRAGRGLGTRGHWVKQSQCATRHAGTGGTDRAKQSQLPLEGVGRGRPAYEGPRVYCAKQTQFPARRVAGDARLCETNPISRAGTCPRAERRGTNMQNKPNLARAPGNGRGRPVVQTNPICRWTVSGKDTQPTKSGVADCAKQTQFRAQPRGTRPGRRGLWDKCAKRTQFATTTPGPRLGGRGTWSAVQTNPICGSQACGDVAVRGPHPTDFAGSSRQTKPISAQGRAGRSRRGGGRGEDVRNEPNLPAGPVEAIECPGRG